MKRALLISLLALSACRTDKPPELSIICIGDGLGGADCSLPGGGQVSRSPSELKNYWMTTQTDQAKFAAWCYGVPPKTANAALEVIKRSATASGD